MSIEYIDNKHARLCVSIGSGANRKRYTKRITYQGKKDAQKQLKAFEDSLCTNYDSRLTVEKLVNMYIQEKITLGIKETTQHGYNACLKRLILAFGDTKANELSLLLVQDFINAESKIKGYKTIKNEVSLLNSSYKYGIQRGLVKENPCQYALLPKSSKKPVNILDKSVLSDFLQDVDNLYYGLKLTTYLALFCGLRKSEILALTIKDVNFDTKTITINKSRHRVDKKDVIQTTKTESSNRVLYVPDFILDIINKENEYLIVNEFGEPLNPNSVSKDFYERVGSKYNISLH